MPCPECQSNDYWIDAFDRSMCTCLDCITIWFDYVNINRIDRCITCDNLIHKMNNKVCCYNCRTSMLIFAEQDGSSGGSNDPNNPDNTQYTFNGWRYIENNEYEQLIEENENVQYTGDTGGS